MYCCIFARMNTEAREVTGSTSRTFQLIFWWWFFNDRICKPADVNVFNALFWKYFFWFFWFILSSHPLLQFTEAKKPYKERILRSLPASFLMLSTWNKRKIILTYERAHRLLTYVRPSSRAKFFYGKFDLSVNRKHVDRFHIGCFFLSEIASRDL